MEITSVEGLDIIGIEGLSRQQIEFEVAHQGARFVQYKYCISVILAAYQKSTDIYFIRGNKSAVGKGLVWSFVSLLFGWWESISGPAYTVDAIVTNFRGGKDMTQEVLAALKAKQPHKLI